MYSTYIIYIQKCSAETGIISKFYRILEIIPGTLEVQIYNHFKFDAFSTFQKRCGRRMIHHWYVILFNNTQQFFGTEEF